MQIGQSVGGYLTPYDYESITVAGAAIGFTESKFNIASTKAEKDLGNARLITATLETGSIRYTVHGANPTAGDIGHLAEPGASFSFANYQAMKNFKAIRETGTSGTLKVTYWR